MIAAIEEEILMEIDILKILAEELRLSTRKKVTTRVHLFSNETTTVKPNSEKILERRMETNHGSPVVMVEGSSDFCLDFSRND